MPSAPQVHPAPEALTAYGRRELSELAAGSIAKHLEGCVACRAMVDSVSGTGMSSLIAKAQGETLNPYSKPTASGTGTPDAAVLEIPSELANYSKYRIIRALGRGGMGVVYLAEHLSMDRKVAIKIVSRHLVGNPEILARFEREVKVVAKLNHPNIVQAHDYEQVQGIHLLVMEFVDGLSLDRVVEKKGPLSVAHACSFVGQAALGLQHAHENGLVHRDIKPHNLMLTRKSVVKVLDFGLALLAQRSQSAPGITATNMFMGTPDYMAPEQASNARTADIRADIYALGCTLYHLLTGRPPFPSGEWLEKVMAHAGEIPTPLIEKRSDIPQALSDFVARMLAKGPAERPATPGEVAKALSPFVKQFADSSVQQPTVK
jgi:eukaryotic-like serine/threonine-protein kinase